jgi:hypothetical protein
MSMRSREIWDPANKKYHGRVQVPGSDSMESNSKASNSFAILQRGNCIPLDSIEIFNVFSCQKPLNSIDFSRLIDDGEDAEEATT